MRNDQAKGKVVLQGNQGDWKEGTESSPSWRWEGWGEWRDGRKVRVGVGEAEGRDAAFNYSPPIFFPEACGFGVGVKSSPNDPLSLMGSYTTHQPLHHSCRRDINIPLTLQMRKPRPGEEVRQRSPACEGQRPELLRSMRTGFLDVSYGAENRKMVTPFSLKSQAVWCPPTPKLSQTLPECEPHPRGTADFRLSLEAQLRSHLLDAPCAKF